MRFCVSFSDKMTTSEIRKNVNKPQVWMPYTLLTQHLHTLYVSNQKGPWKHRYFPWYLIGLVSLIPYIALLGPNWFDFKIIWPLTKTASVISHVANRWTTFGAAEFPCGPFFGPNSHFLQTGYGLHAQFLQTGYGLHAQFLQTGYGPHT